MAVNLSPIWGAGAQLLDNSGNVLSGGKIYTYAAGTTTQVTTFTSNTGTVDNSNPIILNSAGRVPYEIWLVDGQNYKFVLKDSNDVLIGTWDNLSGINSNFVSFTSGQEIQTATAGQTVFNLIEIQYLPGTNSLSVFVDGVNQYGPGAQYAYEETDSNTVTFASGIHVGASVKFTTSQQQNAGVTNASQIEYDPLTGPATNVQARLREYEASTGAALIGFDPTTQLTATNVQDAIEEVETNLLALTPGLLTPRTKPTDFSYVPGNIFDCVTSGQAKHDIDLEWEFRTAYKSIMGPEYGPTFGAADTWVDPVNGSDLNVGSFANPVKTIKHAVQTTYGTIWLMPATYTEKLDIRYSDRPGRAMMIKAWGADGSAVLYAAGQQPSAMTWTASGSGWAATPSGGELAELIIYNKNGKEYPIQYETSKANVDAQAYGWYQNPTTKEIYMRYEGLDINANKADFEICYSTPGNRWFSGATIFFKGIKFRAGNQLDIVYENTNRPRFYAQNCSFEYMAGSNVHTEGALIMTQNCTSRNALVNDGFNYYDSVAGYPSASTPGGVVTQAVEIDNICINNGVQQCAGFVNYPANQPRNKQGSSGHQGTIVARINGEYYGNYGQNIADTGTASKTWLVGTTCRNPQNIYVAYPTVPSSTPNGYYDLWVEGTCYLDTVVAGGRLSTYGLWVESGTSYVYRCGFSGTSANTGGSGTIVQKTNTNW